MTNSNLIPVFSGQISNQSTQLCNARELHAFLQSRQEFANWIKDRIAEYGFVQDEDYIIITERTAGRPRKEYHITLDMGKELGMLERSQKGREIRQYFIRCERKLKALQNTTQIQPLAEEQQELLSLLVRSYQFLFVAHDLREKVNPTVIGIDIEKHFSGYHLYNLGNPLRQHLDKIREYIHGNAERVMFVESMQSLLTPTTPKKVVFR